MPTTPVKIDVKRLAAEASAQHGIRIDPDDPLMAVATVNRLVLEQVVDHMVERIEGATREFERPPKRFKCVSVQRLPRSFENRRAR